MNLKNDGYRILTSSGRTVGHFDSVTGTITFHESISFARDEQIVAKIVAKITRPLEPVTPA